MLDNVPMAGDVVVCLGGREIGQTAVIGGLVDKVYDLVDLTYNYSAFRDDKHVSASGGCGYVVAANKLVDSGEVVRAKFWRWKDGIAGAGNGFDYEEDVRLWLYISEETNSVYPPVTLQEWRERKQIAFDGSMPLMPLKDGEKVKLYRGDYPISYHDYPSDFGTSNVPTDEMGKKLVAEYKKFGYIWLFEHSEPVGCGYLYTLKSTYTQFAFRNKEELNNFLAAYALTVEKAHGNQSKVLPNIDFDRWQPLRWVQTKKVA